MVFADTKPTISSCFERCRCMGIGTHVPGGYELTTLEIDPKGTVTQLTCDELRPL